MTKTFQLIIITPERQVLSEVVEFMAAPSVQGELGILPGHTHLLAELAPGELRYKKNEETSYFSVAGGFLEVHPDRTLVFAEAAELAGEIDAARAQAAAEKARAILRDPAASDFDLEKAQAALRRALVRLRLTESMRFKRRP